MAGPLTLGMVLSLHLLTGHQAADPPMSPAPETGAQAVGTSDVRDGALYLPRWNMTLPAPTPAWSWWALRQRSGDGPRTESFLCIGPAGERFVVTALENPIGVAIGDDFIRVLRAGIQRTSDADGTRFSEFEAQRTDVPLAGSYRMSASTGVSEPKGKWVQSVSGSDVVYLIQAYFPRGRSTETFDRFIAGLSLLHRQDLAPSATKSRAAF